MHVSQFLSNVGTGNSVAEHHLREEKEQHESSECAEFEENVALGDVYAAVDKMKSNKAVCRDRVFPWMIKTCGIAPMKVLLTIIAYDASCDTAHPRLCDYL